MDSIILALQNVKDPEIDSISIVELGMLHHIHLEKGELTVELLPTFMGCPALDIIEKNVVNELSNVSGVHTVHVHFVHSTPWTSNRITLLGREGLKEFGIAPPPHFIEGETKWEVDCPYCESLYTTMENLFGPTACRSILYCKSCRNPFEAMKPISTLM
ncbi:1,2-phenylacetyl-CoA epoxidase subunit PaaD [Bacillus coahuilensis]|uniref:1,2-phenylacetyl-CoA epoxidase subunit PaaD n=1 Tax=Bacillus coahuilensis TaxID=408580 RepID=UPI0001850B83|nr:1,2-phenylacetyl-CoA epoxidase subunit PaaD [Bacillus coahuilensis]